MEWYIGAIIREFQSIIQSIFGFVYVSRDHISLLNLIAKIITSFPLDFKFGSSKII